MLWISYIGSLGLGLCIYIRTEMETFVVDCGPFMNLCNIIPNYIGLLKYIKKSRSRKIEAPQQYNTFFVAETLLRDSSSLCLYSENLKIRTKLLLY